MTALLHRIAHRFGWWGGHVTTWYDGTGRLMVGLRCADCGDVFGIAPAARQFQHRPEVEL